jgi:hypothetical protein
VWRLFRARGGKREEMILRLFPPAAVRLKRQEALECLHRLCALA